MDVDDEEADSRNHDAPTRSWTFPTVTDESEDEDFDSEQVLTCLRRNRPRSSKAPAEPEDAQVRVSRHLVTPHRLTAT